MAANFCGHCGDALAPGAGFCGRCGGRVTAAPAAAEPEDESAATTLPRLPEHQPPGRQAPAYAFVTPPVPPPSAPVRRSGGRAPLVVGFVLLMFVAGAGIGFVLTRGGGSGSDADGAGERAGALEVLPAGFGNGVSVLDRPAGTWTLMADEILPGGTLGVLEYVDGPSYGPELLGFEDVAVAYAERHDESTQTSTSVIVGVEAATGKVAWQHDDVTPTCAAVYDENLLVCPRADDRAIVAIDPETGEVVGEQAMSAGSVSFLDDGTTLYVMHRGAGGEDFAVDALRLPDLDPLWSRLLDTSVIGCCHGDYVMQLDGPVLAASFINAEWHIDRLTGAALSSSSDADWALLPGYDTADDAAEGTTVLTDDSGREVLTAPGYIWGDLSGRNVVDGRIGIGSSLYDLETGTAVWTSPAIADSATWLPDHEHLLASEWDRQSTTSVVDAGDGSVEVPALPGHLSPAALVTTEDAAVAAGGDGWLTVHDLDTGELAWSEDLTHVAPDEDLGQRFGAVALTARTVVAAGTDGLVGFGDFPGSEAADESGDGDTSYTTACGAPPEFVPVSSAPANGGITITYEVRATCPGGQWLNLSQLRVPFVVDGDGVSADAGYVYADGYFDFSDDPYWIPDDGETLELVYPYDQTSVPADDIEAAIDDDGGSGVVVHVPCEPGPDSVDGSVPSAPDYGADPADPNLADGAPDQDDGSDTREESALEALRRIAAEDEAAVDALDWTAQLSSKQPGTRDDGMVYDSYDDILALHLQLRAQYPDSLLLDSSDWPGTYGPSSRDYWVTLSGGSDPTTQPVLDWCRSSGRGEADCWAVRPRRTGDPALNVDWAPADARNN